MYVEPEKLDHFLSFITSTHTVHVQDLPFGEKSLKLSSVEVQVPNVIGSTIQEHIIEQYKAYCRESGFIIPMSRSTLRRILNVCSARVRKSLQGIDYVAAEGAKARMMQARIQDFEMGDEFL